MATEDNRVLVSMFPPQASPQALLLSSRTPREWAQYGVPPIRLLQWARVKEWYMVRIGFARIIAPIRTRERIVACEKLKYQKANIMLICLVLSEPYSYITGPQDRSQRIIHFLQYGSYPSLVWQCLSFSHLWIMLNWAHISTQAFTIHILRGKYNGCGRLVQHTSSGEMG
jgi:hypothetical protein